LLSELKILKKRIDKNIVKLEKIVPHSKDISNEIEILLQKNADDTMIQRWKNGVLEQIKNIKIALQIIEKKETTTLESFQNINPQDKLKKLQILIIAHIEELMIEYPYTLLVYNAIEELILMNASQNLIQSWLKSIDDFMILIERKSSI